MIIRAKSYARAGLVGNPSDGYFGKTISFIVRDFGARVTLYESPVLEILPNAFWRSLRPIGVVWGVVNGSSKFSNNHIFDVFSIEK